MVKNFITLYSNGGNDAGHTGILNPMSPIFDQEPGCFLNPSEQLVLFAFDVLEIVVRELGPFLLEFAFGDMAAQVFVCKIVCQ